MHAPGPAARSDPHHLSRQKTRRGVKTSIPSHVIPPSWLPLAALPARRPTLGHDALSSGLETPQGDGYDTWYIEALNKC